MQALAAYGLNIDDLSTTIANDNSNAPKGKFDGTTRPTPLTPTTRFRTHRTTPISCGLQERHARLPARRRQSLQGAENDKLASWSNDTPAILLNVQRQPGANVIAVVDSIKKCCREIEAGLPPRST